MAEEFPVTVTGVSRAAEVVSSYLQSYGPYVMAWATEQQYVARIGDRGAVAVYLNFEEPRRIDSARWFPSFKEGLEWMLREEFEKEAESGRFMVTCGPESRCVTEEGARDGCDVDLLSEKGEVEFEMSWCVY